MGKGPKAPGNTLGNQGALSSSFAGLANNWSASAAAPIGAATNYYTSLLHGGPAAQNAVAPSAMNIRNVYSGNENTLKNFMPAGGERNLAVEQNQLRKTGSIADLYANVQPQAAQSLASLGGLQSQIGQGFGGLANQGLGSLIQYQSGQNQAKGQALGGIGGGIGSLAGGALFSPFKPWIF